MTCLEGPTVGMFQSRLHGHHTGTSVKFARSSRRRSAAARGGPGDGEVGGGVGGVDGDDGGGAEGVPRAAARWPGAARWSGAAATAGYGQVTLRARPGVGGDVRAEGTLYGRHTEIGRRRGSILAPNRCTRFWAPSQFGG